MFCHCPGLSTFGRWRGEADVFFIRFIFLIKVIFCTFIWHHLQASPLKIRNNVQKKADLRISWGEVRWGEASYVSEAKV